MYANTNNLRVYGIKDFGWPVILFDDAPNAEFLYNFYKAYFDEVRQEDLLNDMADRIERLKAKYITSEVIEKIDKLSSEVGSDMIIAAQDVTDEMLDTLQVEDYNNGDLIVSYSSGEPTPTVFSVRVGLVNGKKMIMDINLMMNQ